jgi:hypothetical protein
MFYYLPTIIFISIALNLKSPCNSLNIKNPFKSHMELWQETTRNSTIELFLRVYYVLTIFTFIKSFISYSNLAKYVPLYIHFMNAIKV